MEVIQIGKRKFTILFPNLLRPLTERELTDLRKSIRKRGVVVPVIVDEDDGVIDGVNRLRLAAELKLSNVPTTTRMHLTDEEREALALSLNADRRQITAEEMKRLRGERIERVAEKRTEGKSQRQIAEEEGISKTQVIRDLEEASTGPGGPVEPEDGKVQGRDGKTRPSSPKKHESASTSEKAAERLAKQRNGKPTFDDREVEAWIGKGVRMFDARAAVHGKDGGFKDVEKQLELLLAAWKRWQRERK